MKCGLGALCLSLTSSVLGCDEPKPVPPAASAPAPPARDVRAPDDLVAVAWNDRPSELWALVRESLPGHALGNKALPSNLEVALTALLDLPVTLAGAFDPEAPLRVALLDDDSLVVSMGLKTPGSFVAALSRGSDATFEASQRGARTVLTRKRASDGLVLSVAGRRLSLARDVDTLDATAPYLERGRFPEAPRGGLSFELGSTALQKHWVPLLEREWRDARRRLAQTARATERQQGRPADFATPAAALSTGDKLVGQLIGWLRTAGPLRGRVTPHREGIELTVTGKRPEGGPKPEPAEKPPWSAARPDAAFYYWGLSSEAARRQFSLAAADEIASWLGSRFSESARLSGAARKWAEGRGRELVVEWTGSSLHLSGDVKNPEVLESAATDFLQLATRPGLREPLLAWSGASTMSPPVARSGRWKWGREVQLGLPGPSQKRLGVRHSDQQWWAYYQTGDSADPPQGSVRLLQAAVSESWVMAEEPAQHAVMLRSSHEIFGGIASPPDDDQKGAGRGTMTLLARVDGGQLHLRWRGDPEAVAKLSKMGGD